MITNMTQFSEKGMKKDMIGKYSFPNIVGRSKAIQEIFVLMEKVIKADVDILITGETGTGKNLVVNQINYWVYFYE